MAAWKKKRSIMRRYDMTAGMYDRRYAAEQEAKIGVALNHIRLVPKDLVLDAGCGTGLLFSHIADKIAGVIGLDSSRESLLLARRRSRAFSNVNLMLADVDNLPFKNRVFSHILAFTLIQNLPRPAATLNEFKRTARSHALFVVTALRRVFSREAFMKLLKDSGLHIVAFEDGDNLQCHIAVCTTVRH